MKFVFRGLLLPWLMCIAAVAHAGEGDSKRGEQLHVQKCKACHLIDENSTGPKHRGVFGRRAGTLESYRYSLALEDQDFDWNEATLDAWMADPSAVVPGNLMGMAVQSAQDRKDIIAYLKTLK